MTKMFSQTARFYDNIYKDRLYKQEAEWLYEWAGKPKTILDIGCGTGRHARYWCKWAKVTGIDSSSDMLKHAYINKNIKYYTNIKPVLSQSFDCVMSIFNVIGYVGFIQFERMLEYLPLKQNGSFIFDVWDIAKMNKNVPLPKVKYFDKGYRIAIPHYITRASLKIDIILIIKNKPIIYEPHYVMGFNKDAIKHLCSNKKYTITDTEKTAGWTLWYKLRKETNMAKKKKKPAGKKKKK